MPDTGQRHEIARLADANEVETVHEAKVLASKTKQTTARTSVQGQLRGQRKAAGHHAAKPLEVEEQTEDSKASARMVDEGDPNKKPEL